MNAQAIKVGLIFAVSAGLMLAMTLLGGGPLRRPGVPTEYLAKVAESIGAIPYRIDGWIGSDVEAQAPAVRLLRPNKLLQRRYVSDAGEDGFSLLIVHCSDVRDMQGHYPPLCYPASGWVITSTDPTSFALGAISTPCRIYRLERTRDGDTQRMTILNFFVVPSQAESLAPDMVALNRAAASLRRSGQGAAQIQLIVNGHVDDRQILTLMERVAPSLETAIMSVAETAGTDE